MFENASWGLLRHQPSPWFLSGKTDKIKKRFGDLAYDEITQKNEYTELYSTLTQWVDRSSVKQAIQELCGKRGGTWLS
ncbi:hypothetical protein [Oscillibacter sp.]|uniref:hypothetical protein n=1 Tax=Oscillibacter sp. TaxID=1945593 RepID=UPI00289D823F|nr:hypothetical protein [Oscillibacter sp.]